MSQMKPVTSLIINNQETPCISGKQIPVVDPSTGKEWLRVDEADKEDVEVAIKYAEASWPAWSATPAFVKAATLRKWGDLIVANWNEIAELECRTIGVLLSTALASGGWLRMILNYMASLVETAKSTVSTNSPGSINYTLHQPFGVTAGIIPWNAPTGLFIVKVAAAVGAGNAIIIKSSEKAPVTPLILGKLAIEAGFPAGLIQVLSGYGPTAGAALAMHMKVRKISFTGSVAAGKLVQKMAAESNLKNVTLELGGKSPAIVFPDADIQNAATWLAGSIMTNAGQICIALSRVFVHTSIKDQFLTAYQAALLPLSKNIGSASDKDTTHGPQVDRLQFDRVKNYLEIAKKEGAKALVGGNALDREGYFIQPTIFTDVNDDATIYREEIFGPVSLVCTFETEEEAVRRANDSEYGLNASVFTKDIDRALRVSAALESGSVGINCSRTAGIDSPFGGYKQSGIGRELGPDSLSAWQETKSVFLPYNAM